MTGASRPARRRARPLRLVPKDQIQQDKIRARCITDLEGLLEMAKSGELVSLMWFADLTGGRQRWAMSGSLDEAGQVGRLRVLEHTLLEHAFAGVDVPRKGDEK
jgi:hypothetical protein